MKSSGGKLWRRVENDVAALTERRRRSSLESLQDPMHPKIVKVDYHGDPFKMGSERSTDSQSFYDSRSDGAENGLLQGKSKKKKRFPLSANLKKTIIRNRNLENGRGSVAGNHGSRSIPDDDSVIESPRRTSASPPMGRNRQAAQQHKKKKVSTMQTLKNRMLLSKSKMKRASRTMQEKMALEDEDDSDSNYQETDVDEVDGELDDDTSVVTRKSKGTEEGSVYSGTIGGTMVLNDEMGNVSLGGQAARRAAARRRSSVGDRGATMHFHTLRDELAQVGEDSEFHEEDEDGQENGTGTDMQKYIRQKLEEWSVPKQFWKIPGSTAVQLHEEEMFKDLENADPYSNYKIIAKLQARSEKVEERQKQLNNVLGKLWQQTQSQLDELRQKVRVLETSLDSFESGVTSKERQIRETFQHYKTDLAREIRERVNKQLESRETDYYSAIGRIREQLNDMTLAEGGVIETITHKGISLVISGAGTVAHLVSVGLGVLLLPLMLFRSVKEPVPRVKSG